MPVVHTITADPAVLEEVFRTQTANVWEDGQRCATIRQMNNVVLGHLVGRLEGNGNGSAHSPEPKPEQHRLFDESAGCASAQDFIEHYRENGNDVDKFGIVREVGAGNFQMHYGKLLEAVARGDVAVENSFSPESGGKVSCVFPEHGDSTPSMYIYLNDERPHFYCFGRCGQGGDIIPSSIPDSVERLPASVRRAGHRGGGGGVSARDTPEARAQQHAVLGVLQEVLTLAFSRSEGEHYVARKRCIDPDLAREYGAGFGTWSVLEAMLITGFSLDELHKAGVIAFSPNVRTNSPFSAVPLLERHGMKLEDIVRRRGKKNLLPYFPLLGRVTFPLSFGGQRTNIYGRNVRPGKFSHVKLSTHVVQGGFNMETLESSAPEIILTEGVFDALTLMSMGVENVMSLIGVLNTKLLGELLTAVAKTGKNVAIAFDHDPNETGQQKTQRIQEHLKAGGFSGTVRDHTTTFIGELPSEEFWTEETGGKWDFNEWWCQFGRARMKS